MLHLHLSNRFEVLSDALAQRLMGPGSGGAQAVFEPEWVLVPSAAVRRRLTLDIAQRHGVCANVRFAYLAQWLWGLVAAAVPGVQARSPLATRPLGWRVYEALGDTTLVQAHPRLAAWLAEADPVMRLDLAQRVAGLLEEATTYRPDWLERWRAGSQAELAGLDARAAALFREDEAWQAALWRRLSTDIGLAAQHPAETFMRLLASGALPGALPGGLREALPPVVHAFALPAIAPLHLQMLQALARHTEVELWVLNPCAEYWFDVADPKRLAWLAARAPARAAEAAHLEVGHRLLAAWGRQAQSHLAMLVAASGDGVVEDAHFVEPAGDSLLARLQRSVLELQDFTPGCLQPPPGDRSIELHVCHSRLRELQVLHDRLLGLFASAAGTPDPLHPGDVLVVLPDLQACAPLVEAVFGTAAPGCHLPYALTGLPRSDANPAARALLGVLSVVDSRWTASTVFGLLQQPPVASAFGLDEEGLEQVRAWLVDAGVHWGLDGAHRHSLGLPAQGRHGFAEGLERLFLGLAVGTGSEQAQIQARAEGGAGDDGLDESVSPFCDTLPAGSAAGLQALPLGGLWRFVQALAQLQRSLQAPHSPSAWPALLGQALQRFVGEAACEPEDIQEVRAALAALGEAFAQAGLGQSLPLAVVREALRQELDDPARGGVPSGAVTFAPPSSLRGLPYRVVCILGLDGDTFPARARPLEFDLLAQYPREGDRQRRSDDRQLFLDLLLSAREVLHLSHTGRSVRDNSELPPSVLVAELLDLLDEALPDDPSRARLRVHHPLQAFSERAFGGGPQVDERLRSFREDYAQALRERARRLEEADAKPADATDPADPAEPDSTPGHGDDEDTDDDDAQARMPELDVPFIATPLAPAGPETRELSLARLTQSLLHPARFLLRQRLQLALPDADEELLDDEPFVQDWPARTALAARLMPALRAGVGDEALQALALAGTELPDGAFGLQTWAREAPVLRTFAQAWARHTGAQALQPQAVNTELQVDGQAWRVHGTLQLLPDGHAVRERYDEWRVRDLIRAWVAHLLLGAGPGPTGAAHTTLVTRSGVCRLRPCADSAGELQGLLRLHQRALHEPLPLFPKSAQALVQPGGSLDKAVSKWRGRSDAGLENHAESADRWTRLVWRGQPDPLAGEAADFQAVSRQLLEPLVAHLEVLEGTPPW